MAQVVAVVACVLALGASLRPGQQPIGCADMEADARARGSKEVQGQNASLGDLRAEQARRLTDVASSFGKRLDAMDRPLDDLQRHGETTRAQTASAVKPFPARSQRRGTDTQRPGSGPRRRGGTQGVDD